MHGFDLAGFHVCCHHFTGDHMVGKYRGELGFVFEQGIQVGFRNLCKGGIRGCKHGERALAFEGVNQACGRECRRQGLKATSAHRRINDVFGLNAEGRAKG